MSTTYTTNCGLRIPAPADRNWDVPLTASLNMLDALAPIGGLCVQAREHPSATLNVKVAAGNYRKKDGTVGTYAGTTSQAIATASTKVLYLTDSGTLTVAASYPTTAHVRLATVVAGAIKITSVTDDRVSSGVHGTDTLPYLPLAGGTLADAANFAFGSTTGSKIGTAASQKLGFFGATAIVQPSGAAQAAATQTQTTLTDSTGGSASTTLAAIAAGASYAQSDMTAARDAIASLAAELALAKADVAALVTLANRLRTDLVALGFIKGSA